MEYRRLGRSGLKLSALSYGSWVTFGTVLDDAGVRDCLALAYDRGVNFFDSAEVYLNGEAERMLGRAIKALRWPRDTFCVSSKERLRLYCFLYKLDRVDKRMPFNVKRLCQSSQSRSSRPILVQPRE